MIDANRKDFFALVADVHAFYKRDFSKFTGGIWWAALKIFDYEAIAEALNRHCINPDVGQFLPMPADVVRMLQGSTQDAALVAWAKVDRAVRYAGTHVSVAFDDPLIHRVLTEMGGWVQLGIKEESDWPFLKNEFVTRYRGYRGRSEIPEYPPTLIGIIEAGNTTAGFKSPPPVLIGDAVRAQHVMLAGRDKPFIAMTRADQLAPPYVAALLPGALS
jgi:hypothetical protein